MKFMEFLDWYPFAITHGMNPLLNSYVNLPNGSNMMWDTTVPLYAIALWPVSATFGAIATWNVAIAGTLVLDGWCSFVWLRRHVAHPMAAWLGGALMEMGPYAAARAHLHLNLLIFFPMPLIFVEIEKLLEGKRSPWGAGAWVGIWAAVELLCCEEIMAIAAVAMLSAGVIAVLLKPQAATVPVRAIIKAAGTTVLVFVVATAVPLGYQFFGRGRVVGPIQGPGFTKTDLLNFVVPTRFTALAPHFATTLSNHWPQVTIEEDSYVGVPLLAVIVATVAKYWREYWARLMSATTLIVAIWSLGPNLQVNGTVEHWVHLPERALQALPVLDNILPARFALFMDFGLAALLAIFTDRAIGAGSKLSRALGLGAVALVCVSLAPQAPISAYSPETPRYFLPGGDVLSLPQGTVALVVPYGDNELTMAPMLWQAQAGFRFRMVSGAMITAGPGGAASLGQPGLLGCILNEVQLELPGTTCARAPVKAARLQLDQLGVKVIIMGPLNYGLTVTSSTMQLLKQTSGQSPNKTGKAVSQWVERFLSAVAGSPPRMDQGVLLWDYAVDATPSRR
jgi:hypothetical protein